MAAPAAPPPNRPMRTSRGLYVIVLLAIVGIMLRAQRASLGLWASSALTVADTGDILRNARAISTADRLGREADAETQASARAAGGQAGPAADGITRTPALASGTRGDNPHSSSSAFEPGGVSHELQREPAAARTDEPAEIVLTAESVRRLARNGTVIATFANSNHLDFVLNWVAHLREAGLDNFFVGCTDTALRDELVARRIRCAMVRSSMPVTEAKWGSSGFAAMGRTKGALVQSILALNASALLFCDLDAITLRDPLPFLARAAAEGADLLMHSDALVASTASRGVDGPAAPLESPRASFGPELNTGYFWVRPSEAAVAAVDAWVEKMKDDRFFANWKNDQSALNEVLRRGGSVYKGDTPIYASAFNGRVKLGILPVHLFASGHTFFVQRLHERFGVRPYAVHVTFVNCDSPGKRSRLRESNLWLGPPDVEMLAPAPAPADVVRPTAYAGSRFLWYDVDLPAEITADFAPVRGNLAVDSPVLHRHWRLMNHQLRQLRVALALAVSTNRTLILPRLLCGLETTTNFAHSGVRCHNCNMTLPYLCPTDHVLRMHYWAGRPPSGPQPQLAIRTVEYSFVESARREALAHALAAAHVEVAVDVRVAPRGSVAAGAGAAGGATADAHAAGKAGGTAARASTSPLARACALPACRSPTRELLDRSRPAANITLRTSDGTPRLSDQSVREQLRAHADAPLLRVRSLAHFDVRFDDAATAEKFETTTKWLTGGWCCTSPPAPGKPGHFFYDIWADVLPHTDRWGRTFKTEWQALPGP